jgi:5'(3')-deoxyribonucleotidase
MKIVEIFENMQENKPIVYVDMDGVLADLYTYAAEISDVDSYHKMTQPQWEKFFKETNAYELFSSIPKFSTANDLLRMVVHYAGGYRILSSPLSFDREGSIRGKKEWLKKNISIPADEEVFAHNKYIYAVQRDGTKNILIDDYGVNTRAWAEHGGIAIKYQADEDPMSKVEVVLKKVFGDK